jgi:hypothetical protein
VFRVILALMVPPASREILVLLAQPGSKVPLESRVILESRAILVLLDRPGSRAILVLLAQPESRVRQAFRVRQALLDRPGSKVTLA